MREHGITTEAAYWRMHIAFVAERAYLFPTETARDAIATGRYRKVTAGQPGVSGTTSAGYLVPPQDIMDCEEYCIPADLLSCYRLTKRDGTSDKGRKAEAICREMIERGLTHLPEDITPITERRLQLMGMDAWFEGLGVGIEFKCDEQGGRKALGGSGNLYLQVEECNPYWQT